MRLTRRTALRTVVGIAAVSGCLSGNDGASSTTSEAPNTDTSTQTATGTATETPASTMGGSGPTVSVASHPELGDVLVGPDGLTLYMFDNDTNGEATSTCYESCAKTWPAFTVSADPTAGDGVSAPLSTFERDGGERQVAADGWPLYYYAPDERPGDANGQGVGGVWWVVAPDGSPVRPESTTTESGGY